MRSVIACALWAAVLVASGGQARAEVESETVQKGVAAYEQADFASAIELLKAALDESLTREEKVVAFRTLAFAYAALERPNDARAAFARLLHVDSRAELDRSVAPRVRALFEEARAEVATGRAEAAAATLPVLRPEVRPARALEGRPVAIRVEHAGGVARAVQLFHRVRGEVRYSEIVAPERGGGFELVVPGSSVRAPGIEYYLTALDEEKVAVARAGSLSEPLVVDVDAPARPRRPIYKRAWFWGVIGGVVAAGVIATAVAVATTSGHDPNAPADVVLTAPR
jgi:tetratricopeptide (TPR) repeat protein